MFDNFERQDVSNPRDCVVSVRGDQVKGHGLHLLLVGAYESVQQQKGWTFDPVMAFLGAYDGKKMIPEAGVAQGERCVPIDNLRRPHCV